MHCYRLTGAQVEETDLKQSVTASLEEAQIEDEIPRDAICDFLLPNDFNTYRSYYEVGEYFGFVKQREKISQSSST